MDRFELNMSMHVRRVLLVIEVYLRIVPIG